MSANTDDVATSVEGAVDQRVRVSTNVAWEPNRYRTVGSLGKGGMGEIQLCQDMHIARPVARKVLRDSVRKDPWFRSRFLFEARLQGQLEHPSIVPVHDVGETAQGELFFTMQRIRGITFDKALQAARERTATHSRRRLLTAFSSVCLAIDFAHSRGVVHRDLKPQNIMLGDFGEVYVLDWGIAKLMDQGDTPVQEVMDVSGAASPTRAGAVLGTPKYMAPERDKGIANAATDVFSLGVILGEILASDETFEVAPELAAITVCATEADPLQRYRSARELHDAIERYLDGDRDLAARRKLADEHVTKAERVLDGSGADPAARTQAGREIGRSLGLDPSNSRALRILMRLLSDVPAILPADAQAALESHWLARRATTMRWGAIAMAALLLVAPFILWNGVRDWRMFAAYVALTVVASVAEWYASYRIRTVWFAIAFVLQIAGMASLTLSCGLLGVVPATLMISMMAWRMNVDRAAYGVLMLLAMGAALAAPFVATGIGWLTPVYEFRDGLLAVVPHMHAFTPTAMVAYMLIVTFGAAAAAVIYGRVFVGEIRRAEVKLVFHAWQLEQLLPPDSTPGSALTG